MKLMIILYLILGPARSQVLSEPDPFKIDDAKCWASLVGKRETGQENKVHQYLGFINLDKLKGFISDDGEINFWIDNTEKKSQLLIIEIYQKRYEFQMLSFREAKIRIPFSDSLDLQLICD